MKPNKEMPADFFKAENESDWNLYQQFLHPEIIWLLYSGEEKRFIGNMSLFRTDEKSQMGLVTVARIS